MSKQNDGGPAFPASGSLVTNWYKGMSLRDWLAGQALAGILGNDTRDVTSYEDSAEAAYNFADAMLAQRAQKGT